MQNNASEPAELKRNLTEKSKISKKYWMNYTLQKSDSTAAQPFLGVKVDQHQKLNKSRFKQETSITP